MSTDPSANIKRCLEADIFPWLGNRLIKDINAPDLLAVLRKIESRGAHEKAQRAREYVGRVFRYAIQTGRAERDPSGDLRGALTPVKAKHHASITDPKKLSGKTLDTLCKCYFHHGDTNHIFSRTGQDFEILG